LRPHAKENHRLPERTFRLEKVISVVWHGDDDAETIEMDQKAPLSPLRHRLFPDERTNGFLPSRRVFFRRVMCK
jgi:hypothetical protein